MMTYSRNTLLHEARPFCGDTVTAPMQAHETTFEQAQELILQSSYSEAAALLRLWLDEHPDDLRGWDLLGMAYFALKEWEPLEEVTRWTCQVAPDSPQAWSNWGMVLRKLRQPQQARDAQERALSLDPTYHRPRIELRKLQRTLAASSAPTRPLFEEIPSASGPASSDEDQDLDLLPYFDAENEEE